MALTILTLVDKALRRMPPGFEPGNVEQALNVTFQRVSRKAIHSEHRAGLTTEISLTLSSADAYGIQSVAIPTTVLPESIPIIDSIRHPDLATTLPPAPVATVARLLELLSTSTLAAYAVEAYAFYIRRPSGALATTASALKAVAVKLIASVSDIPLGMEGIVEDTLVEVFSESIQAAPPAQAGDGTASL